MESLIFLLLGMLSITGGVDCPTRDMKAYTVLPGTVFICKDKTLTDVDIVHELSHIFYYNIMTKSEREVSLLLYNYCDKQECFSRKYGMVNEIEDFATSFEGYYNFYKLDKGNYLSTKNYVLRVKLMYIHHLINKKRD